MRHHPVPPSRDLPRRALVEREHQVRALGHLQLEGEARWPGIRRVTRGAWRRPRWPTRDEPLECGERWTREARVGVEDAAASAAQRDDAHHVHVGVHQHVLRVCRRQHRD
eukprot:1238699-Prymnesium_polylepis.1